MRTYRVVPAQFPHGDDRLLLVLESPPYRVRARLRDGRQFAAEGADFFFALLEVRRLLELQGIRLRIAGAARNVWTLGPNHLVFEGLLLGRYSDAPQPGDDFIDIFEEIPIEAAVTVDEQIASVAPWLSGGRPSPFPGIPISSADEQVTTPDLQPVIRHTVAAVGPDGVTMVHISYRLWPVFLGAELPDGTAFSATANSFYGSLLELLSDPETQGIRLCIQGARPDVWPSGMSADMFGGLDVHAHTADGEPVGDALYFFDPANCELIIGIKEAEAWRQRATRAFILKRSPETLLREALRARNGWVFQIDHVVHPGEQIAARSIQGAWQIDGEGLPVNLFPNPHYQPPSGEAYEVHLLEDTRSWRSAVSNPELSAMTPELWM